jgi:CRISPR-associated protein Cas4
MNNPRIANEMWDIVYEKVPRLKEPETRVANFASNLWVLMECPRRYWFDAVEPHFSTTDWELKANHGNYLHEMIVDYFKMAGVYRGHEVRGSNQEFNIQYRIDVLIQDHLGNIVPVEIKSANANSMKRIEKEGPYNAHIYQLMAYLGFHGTTSGMAVYPYGYILYYNKNSDKVVTYRLDFDIVMFAEIMERLLEHNERVKTMTMPELCEDKEKCKNCPYRDRCYALEDEP